MDNERLPKLILNLKPEGRRNFGRHKIRKLHDIETDLKALGVK